MPPPTIYQVPGNYDQLASCFARRAKDRKIVNPVESTPVLERFSNPDEIRVTMGGNGLPLVWIIDFKPSEQNGTALEFRMETLYAGAHNIRGRAIEDLRACGAEIS
jgi:hypothetical protein